MPYSDRKSVLHVTETWTIKHRNYCLENSITPAAQLLWEWLIDQEKVAQEIEPDLVEFNKHVKKHRGKGYCRLTLKNALNQLIEHRIIQLIKQYTWRIVKIITRPLDWLLPKKDLRNRNKIYALQPSNPEDSVSESKQQQQSSNCPNADDSVKQENQEVLAKSGIYIDIKCNAILTHSTLEIKLAIIMFYLKGGFKKIDQNPEGWIRQCLEDEYWEEPSNYQRIIKYLFRDSTHIPAVDFEDVEHLIDKAWKDLTGNNTC